MGIYKIITVTVLNHREVLCVNNNHFIKHIFSFKTCLYDLEINGNFEAMFLGLNQRILNI